MQTSEYEYLIALDISPRDVGTKIEHAFVTKLLGVRPTKVHRKGEKIAGALGQVGKRYDRWHWRLATRALRFDERVSERLVAFLGKLPSQKAVWKKVHAHCDCRIYLPLERQYFLIELEIEPSALLELARRNLPLSVSALARVEEPNPESWDGAQPPS